jgi:uncharacterized protein with HEPN domain
MQFMPSDPDSIRRRLHDIQHHIAMAQGFVAGMSYETFRDDLRTTYAVIRCLEIFLKHRAACQTI